MTKPTTLDKKIRTAVIARTKEVGWVCSRCVYMVELEARVKEMEAMMPRWVKDDSASKGESELAHLGWTNASIYKTVNGVGYWLMVPPIPLPGAGG